MTKKDYVAIGKAIRESMINPEWVRNREQVAKILADVFAADNPSFDRERFLRFVETGKDTRS